MSKFKVGQKVRFAFDASAHGFDWWKNAFDGLVNKPLTISSIRSAGTLYCLEETRGWYFKEAQLVAWYTAPQQLPSVDGELYE